MIWRPGWSRTLPVAMALTVACAGFRAPQAPVPAGLSQVNWHLVTLDGRSPVVSTTGLDLSLKLAADLGASGYAGCGQFGAVATINGDSLRLGALTSQDLDCSGNRTLERVYLAALASTDRFEVSPDSLVLFQGGEPGLVYKR
ncbi:MAG TPA: META domain-containing protein [Gemmatimonadales bacterium]|nr:META domain-containing protein [Gemmatimonadales bacterium]